MATKYKLYIATESGDLTTEFYTKKELEKHRYDESESLFELAERMVYKFNRYEKDQTKKRYAYKLEKVSVVVLGSEQYYGLNISTEMCNPEFK